MRWLLSITLTLIISGCNLPAKTPPPDPFKLSTAIALTGCWCGISKNSAGAEENWLTLPPKKFPLRMQLPVESK